MAAWTLHGTIWTDKERPQGNARSWTWEELLVWFRAPAKLAPGDGPEPDDPAERKAWKDARKAHLAGWSPTHFAGNYRKGSNVAAVGAVLLDLDSDPAAELPKRGEPDLDPARLQDAMRAALPPGTTWAAHTSPSSSPDAWRWRVVVPLSEAVDADTHRALTAWLRLRLAVGEAPAMAESDPAPSMDPARLWFVPARDDDNPDAYATSGGEGDPLHVPAVVGDLLAKHKGAPIDGIAAALVADCEAMRGDKWPTAGTQGAERLSIAGWLDLQNPPESRPMLLTRRDPSRAGGGTPPNVGVLPLGMAGALAGAGGAGKTTLLVSLALAVAGETKWLGAVDVATPGRVAVLLGETDEQGARGRLWHAARAMKLGDDARRDAMDRIALWALGGKPAWRFTDENGAPTGDLDNLLSHLRGEPDGWRLIILDPLSRFAGRDAESNNSLATGFVQAVEQLTRLPGSPAVICAHHTSQAGRKEGIGDATDVRGVTAIVDGFRWVAMFKGRPRLVNIPGVEPPPELADLAVIKANEVPMWKPGVTLQRGNRGELFPAKAEDMEKYDFAALVNKALLAREKERIRGAEKAGKAVATDEDVADAVKAKLEGKSGAGKNPDAGLGELL